MRFDWRSEQEDEWQTEVPAATARTRHFRFLLSLAMLALVVAVALFRFGELRAEAVQESTREEVVAASDLLRDAAAQGDRELLDSLWGGGHAERADRGAVDARSEYGPLPGGEAPVETGLDEPRDGLWVGRVGSRRVVDPEYGDVDACLD